MDLTYEVYRQSVNYYAQDQMMSQQFGQLQMKLIQEDLDATYQKVKEKMPTREEMLMTFEKIRQKEKDVYTEFQRKRGDMNKLS